MPTQRPSFFANNSSVSGRVIVVKDPRGVASEFGPLEPDRLEQSSQNFTVVLLGDCRTDAQRDVMYNTSAVEKTLKTSFKLNILFFY